MQGQLRNWLLGFGLSSTLCILPACGNLGPTGGHRAQFTAGTITSLSPSTIMAGGPPLTLTVNGSNLSPGNSDVLLWNGVQQVPQVVTATSVGSTTQATYVIDASLIENPGNISIVLIVPNTNDRPSNTLTFTIAPRATTACALFGLYDFLFTGFDTSISGVPQFNKNDGGAMFAGAFGVDANGNISGELDFTNYPFRGGAAADIAGATISGICTDSATPNQGTLTFTLANNPTLSGTFTYTFVLQQGGSGPARGRLVEPGDMNTSFGTLAGTGVFVATGPDAVLNGDYAFGLAGIDPEGGGGLGSQISAAGRFTLSNVNLSAGVADINDGGSVMANASLSGAQIPVPPDVFSRITANLIIGGLQVPLSIYVNSSGGGFAIGGISSQTAIAGVAGFISPQANAGDYNDASLNAPLVFSTWGVPAPLYTGAAYTTSSDTTLGLASGFNSGAGTFNLQFDQVAAGVAHLNRTVAGATYSVSSNGRATVSYKVGANTLEYVYYLDGANDGFILGESGTTAEFGFFQPQASGPFTTSTINGTFASATFLPMTPASPNLATEITLNNGALSASTPAGAVSGTYTVASSGRGTASVNLPVLGGSNLVFYVIGPGSVEVMGSDNTMSDAIAFMHF